MGSRHNMGTVTSDMLKPIPGCPHYLACSDGRIFSLYMMGWLAPHLCKSTGYYQATLCEDGVKHQESIHRLVASAFLPNESNLPIVNHIDENKANNRVDNLEWCTCSENIRHGTARQRAVETVGIERLRYLANEARKKRVFKKVRNVDTGELFANTGDAARAYGLRHSGINAACTGASRTCGGYRWKYEE